MKRFTAVFQNSKTSKTSSYFAKLSVVLHPFREKFCKTFRKMLRETAKYGTFHETLVK
jgi:hypothetical protein